MLARRITLHKIDVLPFSILPWQTLWAILVSSIGKNEIILAGIIENKSYNIIFNNTHWQFNWQHSQQVSDLKLFFPSVHSLHHEYHFFIYRMVSKHYKCRWIPAKQIFNNYACIYIFHNLGILKLERICFIFYRICHS